MECTLEELYQVPELQNVPREQLDWFRSKSTHQHLQPGDYLFKKGDPVEHLYIVVKGRIEIKLEQNGSYRHIAYMEPLSIGGALPFSRASTAIGYGEVLEQCSLLAFAKADFKELTKHYELTEAFVHHMSSRVRSMTKSNVQQEKMMALGKLSAGLAHELNNPASAIRRSALELKRHLSLYPERFKAVMTMRLTAQQVDPVNDIIFDRIENRPVNDMKLMQRSEKEDELAEWLEDNGVEDGYELAETLIEFCMGIDEMQKVHDIIGAEQFPGVAAWISNVLTTEKMVSDIEDASARIEELVSSVKGYTHMDQFQDKVQADVHKGLDNTLKMLKHQLKKNNISIAKNYCEDCPKPFIRIGEMNQVWTNLIDNAIDAMKNGGELRITTHYDKDLYVRIADTGTGIPPEVQDRIFEPFFTTKSVGEGTGMGLEVTQRIIHQHGGHINVKSSSKGAEFTVCLPLK
jgi:signal transduction histidine kinase